MSDVPATAVARLLTAEPDLLGRGPGTVRTDHVVVLEPGATGETTEDDVALRALRWQQVESARGQRRNG